MLVIAQARQAAGRTARKLRTLKQGELFVVGCSSSEIMAGISAMTPAWRPRPLLAGCCRHWGEQGVYLAALNAVKASQISAIVLEREAASTAAVAAIPRPMPGGSWAQAAPLALRLLLLVGSPPLQALTYRQHAHRYASAPGSLQCACR